jgi:hypothetical protein
MGTLWSVIIATDNGVRQRASNLCPRRTDNGLEAAAHLAQRDPPGVSTVHCKRDETRLGVRVALAHGSGDLRDDHFVPTPLASRSSA